MRMSDWSSDVCSSDLAAAGTVAAVGMGFPAIVSAQTPINLRVQSTWPTVDIFHEYALDFAKKINDMTGGELKIEVLPAGAVVPAFALLDAVSKGTLDGGHGVLGYNYGKQNALALYSSGPAFGMDANMVLARSEERRVGKERVSTCRSRWSPLH